jgi:PAS domain S-box-containing protein
MDSYQKDLAKIREVLSGNPKGMSITDIAESVRVNRNAVAKYMDILQIQGAVDSYRVGTSKLYFRSSRLPAASVQKVCTRPFVLIDKDGIVTDANRAFCDRTGRPHESVVLQPFGTLPVTCHTTDTIQAAFRDAIRGREQRITGALVDRDGQQHAATFLIEPVVFENGRPGAAMMIEEREHASPHAGLHSAFSDFLALLDDEIEYVIQHTPDGTIRFVNETYCRAAGKRKEDLAGHPFRPLVSAEDAERIRTHLAGLTQQNPVATIEYKAVMAEGEIRWQRWKDRALFDDRGALTGYQSCGTDITELISLREQIARSSEKLDETVQQKTRELKETNRQLYAEIAVREKDGQNLLWTRLVLDSTPFMTFLLNRKGHIQHTNSRARDLTGRSEESLRSAVFSDIFPGYRDEVWEDLIRRSHLRGHVREATVMMSRTLKPVPVEIQFHPMKYQGDEWFCCFAAEPANGTQMQDDAAGGAKGDAAGPHRPAPGTHS